MNHIRRLQAEGTVKGIHGPIIELFTANSAFYRCIEVTGGSALFHVVVENDNIAQQCIRYLAEGDARQPRGRLTFIPLNRLEPHEPSYPKGGDIIPLIDKLRFSAQHRQALLQVFGNTVVCRDLTVASTMSLTHNLNGIILEGDRVDRKGALTGGGHGDRHSSRLEAMANFNAARQKHTDAEKQRQHLQQKVEDLEQGVASAHAELSKVAQGRSLLIQQIKDIHAELVTLQHRLPKLQDQLTELVRDIERRRAAIAQLNTQLQGLQQELATEMSTDLTDDEQAELERLTAQVTELKKKLVGLANARTEAQMRRDAIAAQLYENLYKQRERLQLITSGSAEDTSVELQEVTEQLQKVQQRVKEIDKSIKETEKELKELASTIDELRAQLENVNGEEAAAHAKQLSESKEMEKLLGRRTLYVTKREECQRKIRELGSLPADAFDKYKDRPAKDLMRELEKVNASLSKMSGVNKKAADQLTSFESERDELTLRYDALLAGHKAIEELIQHLDDKKDDAIQRTFKAIAKNFTQVFAELVPGGKASLVIRTAAQRGDDDVSTEQDTDKEEEAEKHVSSAITRNIHIRVLIVFVHPFCRYCSRRNQRLRLHPPQVPAAYHMSALAFASSFQAVQVSFKLVHVDVID